MKTLPMVCLAVLAGYAGLIWWSMPQWLAAPSDTLPVLAGLPLIWWFGRPWIFRREAIRPSLTVVALAASLILVSAASGIAVLMALSWMVLLAIWMHTFVTPHAFRHRWQLLVLGLLAFPWVNSDGQTIGWFFRLSGAYTIEHAFRALGFVVERQGTMLLIQGLPISVEPACAGLGVLQAMLIAGAVVIYTQCRRNSDFILGLLFLPVMAWLANTTRIFTLSATALTFGSDFARSAFHTWGGWVALCAMFVVCCAFFSKVSGYSSAGGSQSLMTRRNIAVTAMVLYAAWSSRSLYSFWRDDPYGHTGWIAMLIWLSPLLAKPIRLAKGSDALLLIGLACTLLGHVLEIHAFHYAGLALIAGSAAGWHAGTLVWVAASVCWMPVLGYLAKAAPAQTVCIARIVMAVAFAAVLLLLTRVTEGASSPSSPRE